MPADRPIKRPDLSLVVPVFDETACIDAFLDAVRPILDSLALECEILFVDDGSTDDTAERILAARASDARIKLVSLSRNFGKDVALAAGLDASRGRAVIPIDVDLQDPPALIPELVAKWRQGYDAVFATRRARPGDSWLKRTTAGAFYRVFNRLAGMPIPPNAGDFRLLDRRVVEALCAIRERARFMKGYYAWVGFRQTSVAYDRPPRAAGGSRWTYPRLVGFAWGSIMAFSTLPLRLWSFVGAAAGVLVLAWAGWRAWQPSPPEAADSAYSMALVAVLLVSLQLVALGVLGSYIGRIHEEVLRRPLYIVRASYGVEDFQAPDAVIPEAGS